MRFLALVVVVGCGSPQSSSVTLQDWQSSMAHNHLLYERHCKGGNKAQCYQYGAGLLHVRFEHGKDHPDWAEPWPLDREGGKQALLTACTDEEASKNRSEACELLVTQKLVTPDEGFAMCTAADKPVPAICMPVSKVGSFDDHHWYQLCAHNAFLCDDAMPHLNDAADKAFADMGTKFQNLQIKITGYAAHAGADADDDDDSGGGRTTSSDSACHKDTDCKGDRICQAGSCVDAGTKAAKPASMGVAECDELAHLIENRVFSCPQMVDQALRDTYKEFRDAWAKVGADRLKAMGPVCKEGIELDNENLEHARCN
jgi:hypothetical protein